MSVLIGTMQCGPAQSGEVGFFGLLWTWIRPKLKPRCLHRQNSVILWAEENRKWTMLSLLVQSPEHLVWSPSWDITTHEAQLSLWGGRAPAPSSHKLLGAKENNNVWIIRGFVSDHTAQAPSSFPLLRLVWPGTLARNAEMLGFGYSSCHDLPGAIQLMAAERFNPELTGFYDTHWHRGVYLINFSLFLGGGGGYMKHEEF